MTVTQRTLTAAILASLLGACAGGSQYYSADTGEPISTTGALHAGDLTPDGEAALVSITLPALAPPSAVRSDCQTYVAWIRAEGRVQRVGRIQYDPTERAGKIAILTALPDFELLVTAEPDPDVAEPSDAIVVRRRVRT